MATTRPTRHTALRLLLAASLLAGGCRTKQAAFKSCGDCVAGDYYATAAADIDYPAVSQCSLEGCDAGLGTLPPRTLSDQQAASYRDILLEEVIQMGLAQSTVLRDLGGSVVRSPQSTQTVYDPAIQETDPSGGIEAALSAFDAQFTTSLFFENNDRALNNQFFGGGTQTFTQDAAVHQMQLSKRSVAGTELAARQVIEYDSSVDTNPLRYGQPLPGNQFMSAYTVKVEGEFRHPLMQGGGAEYNRIAGPTRTPGVYNGVLIARLKTDVQLTEFEIAVRDLVSNLENAYWDLYFAYRDLDAKIAARDSALDTWRRVQALYETGRRGGEAEKEAQAREQYYRFQEEVENALSGRLFDGTRTNNGSAAGTFRGNGGVYVAERRLRRLMNLPASDGTLLRPAQEPIVAEVVFDWDQVMLEAIDRRAELRRQKWGIRRRELELIASKNHLLPRLDAVGRYRWRGFGDHLLDNGPSPDDRFDNAFEDLGTGDFQEWQLGLELDIPIGYRQAHSAVRNAELLLARERAMLCDQQQEIVHQAANAVADVDRALRVSQTSYNRLVASRNQLDAVSAAFESDKAPLNLLLDAQRRLAEAESRYHRTVTEYAVSIKNMHFVKGTLLEFDGVFLTEGGWPGKAYQDARDLEDRRGGPREMNYASRRAPAVSRGVYDQHRDACQQPAMHGAAPAEPMTAAAPTARELPAIEQPVAVQPTTVQPPATVRPKVVTRPVRQPAAAPSSDNAPRAATRPATPDTSAPVLKANPPATSPTPRRVAPEAPTPLPKPLPQSEQPAKKSRAEAEFDLLFQPTGLNAPQALPSLNR
ncbi:Outer membrane efflux protein [Posidoniimonas polymericola]|uniref:Outer membrane efflux protein n=1 Tax=Posidoniimonas polymericola TaxID=2528002 RepID=A0A5C5YRU2_9BACT|nr:TolC family protein [Posidoniimonas polymericola]TWT77625.1 Outer membrane efflux protein [Posidoniimonas polymericola]